jgi:phosphoribosylaminoimidazole-succinocarboxamide synthase
MTQSQPALFQTDFPGLVQRGKVRDIYDAGPHLMIVASDRISAFDVVMQEPVPGKGALLTGITEFWLQTLPACRPHHLEYVVSDKRVPPEFAAYGAQLRGRAMVVKRAKILPVECIVRGYIIGSGWKEYQAAGSVSGVPLPPGLRKAERLPVPIFTPSTKATVGHDELISFAGAVDAVRRFLETERISGFDAHRLMEQVRERSLAIYGQASTHAEARGIILADTKFEFGLRDGELLLADEVLTPDSSRFWPREKYVPGQDPPSFDKQFLRDYLETLSWDKRPPPPSLPADIVAQTAAGYQRAYALLTR